MTRVKAAKTIQYENQLIQIINELRDYWPLTVRQVYYQMVKKLYIQNKDSLPIQKSISYPCRSEKVYPRPKQIFIQQLLTLPCSTAG